jgi:hypothetical protein
MGFFIIEASCNVYSFSLIVQGNNKSTWWMVAIYPKGIKNYEKLHHIKSRGNE